MHGGCEENARGIFGGNGRLNVKAESVKPKRKSKNSCDLFEILRFFLRR
jgi:hypothetical protein